MKTEEPAPHRPPKNPRCPHCRSTSTREVAPNIHICNDCSSWFGAAKCRGCNEMHAHEYLRIQSAVSAVQRLCPRCWSVNAEGFDIGMLRREMATQMPRKRWLEA